jgi:hypothetical protein
LFPLLARGEGIKGWGSLYASSYLIGIRRIPCCIEIPLILIKIALVEPLAQSIDRLINGKTPIWGLKVRISIY